MSYCLRVFCQSKECPTRSELAAFIDEGAYFGEPPTFDPPPSAAESDEKDWARLSVSTTRSRAIEIERALDGEVLRSEVEKLLFVLSKTNTSKARESIMALLKEARQMISFSIDPDLTEDDEWEMLDAVESHLLKECNGVLFVPREGFYDSQLQLVHRI